MKMPFDVPPRMKVAGMGFWVCEAVMGGVEVREKEDSRGGVAEGAAERGAVLEDLRVCLFRRRWPAA